MTQPVQLWAPFISLSPLDPSFSRDLQRAMEVQRDEVRIWTKPDVPQTVRWSSIAKGLNALGANIRVTEALIKGEQINSFTIYHIDEERRLYPALGSPQSPITTLPNGLYRKWLNARPEFINAPREFLWDMPRIVDGEVKLETAQVSCEPGPIVPQAGVDVDDRIVHMQWPPENTDLPRPISPETESANYYGRLRRRQLQSGDQRIEVIETENDPSMRAAAFWLKWPAPFDAMFPIGGGADILYHQALLHHCVDELAAGNRTLALQTAEAWVHRLVGQGRSSLEKAWFLPKLTVNVEAALMDVEGKFGVSAATLAELLSSSFHERLIDGIEVQRINGWLGYFWLEFHRDLQDGISLCFCSNCGQLIQGGRSDRAFCSTVENPECVRQRSAKRQQKSRAIGASRKRPKRGRGSY